jgi:glycosyltransferase involved in cell wall biosynthesis
MKLLLLADPGSIHTIRWARALSERGIIVYIFGLSEYDAASYYGSEVKLYSARIPPFGLLNKLKYLTCVKRLRSLIREIKPDLVHAHYASSYGLLGRLCSFKPLVVSVWGSDIYDFPKKSIFHKYLLKFNLQNAKAVCSTSCIMAEETRKYLPGKTRIEVTPFGVDLNLFRPFKEKKSSTEVIIGTVKTLNRIYGIDTLIESFSILIAKKPHLSLKLVIAGEGSEKEVFTEQVKRLGLENKVIFVGKVQHLDVPKILNQFHIYVALSNYESFGVAVIEASACAIPVVVSDAGGLKEVVKNGKTGVIVPRQNAGSAAQALAQLVENPALRQEMGRAGREHVQELYDWHSNVDHMEALYHRILTENVKL